MAAVHQLDQPGGIDMGVDLGGRDVGVAKKGLEHAQIRAARKQVRGECVTEDMGADAIGSYPGKGSHAANQLEQPDPAEVRFAAWK